MRKAWLGLVMLMTATSAVGCGRATSPAESEGGFPHPQIRFETNDDDDGDGDEGTPDSTPVDPDPAPTATPVDGDDDGDGIPDDQDNLPCAAFRLRLSNVGVSSASVGLNGTEIVSQNSFPTSEVIQLFINPVNGPNTIALGGKLNGSPGDELHFLVESADAATVYLDQEVVRQNGSPQQIELGFSVDIACGS